MSDVLPAKKPNVWQSPTVKARIAKRYAAERRFKALGFTAIALATLALVALLSAIVVTAAGGFMQSHIRLTVTLDEATIGAPAGANFQEQAQQADYGAILRRALQDHFPEVKDRRDVRALTALLSAGARMDLQDAVLADPSLVGQTVELWLTASDDADMFAKGKIAADVAESDRQLDDHQIKWLQTLQADGRLRTTFNWRFFTAGDSREPELAGILGAAVGSILTLIITLIFAFPMGVCAAVYLEEFAPQSRWTDLIEVNINNLAAVPSIVFGLLGLAMFLGFFHLPRSAPIVGGLTLGLMTLPTIIITARAAIKAVPPSIRAAATGLGASKVQVVVHHVLPLALPGILTGAIIGMGRALGETAPLLMIGMVAFIVDVPHGFTDAATALPVQIYLWADSPERGFIEKTSAAILVLLGFLILMNALAIWLRQKFERRW